MTRKEEQEIINWVRWIGLAGALYFGKSVGEAIAQIVDIIQRHFF